MFRVRPKGFIADCETAIREDGSLKAMQEVVARAVSDPRDAAEAVSTLVAIEPDKTGKASTFALVYVRTRGKPGEI